MLFCEPNVGFLIKDNHHQMNTIKVGRGYGASTKFFHNAVIIIIIIIIGLV